jgi:putative restriction endonuclease
MGRGVFIHRSDSIYDDSPAERYQFPKQYLGRVQACVGYWVIYYEPRKAATARGYFAIAKVDQVIPDPNAPGMYMALIEAGSYLDFINPVPFSGPDGVIETGVLNEAGRISGRAQAAVRPISTSDFNRIISIGINEDEFELPRIGEPLSSDDGFSEGSQAPFIFGEQRDRVLQLSSRIVRDRLFRRLILQAYDKRCAITGLKLINGGGRAEVDAAQIKPVEANGPDILTNGIALSGTAHWMFDRGLIGLSDDLDILVSRQANDADSIRGLINPTGRAIVPSRSFERPHPQFLHWHRQNCFKH